MGFEEIIGQKVIVDSLKRAVSENKAANGYIFSGPAGCGKMLTAYIFAMALNCKEEQKEKPCGSCSSCLKMRSGNHPNYEIIRPTGASIKIKQIRQVISDISKKPFESGYKVVVLENADKMTHEAQDAFLKTLEEPPKDTVFILLVENVYSLLPTVISRCQVFPLKRVVNSDIENHLRKKFNSKDVEIKLAVLQSEGIIGKAEQILSNNAYFENRDKSLTILDSLFKQGYIKAIEIAEQAIDSKPEAEELLKVLLEWFRDILVYKEMNNSSELITNIDRMAEIEYYNNMLTEDKLNRIISEILKTFKYLSHNVSIKNSIDGMLLNISEVCNG